MKNLKFVGLFVAFTFATVSLLSAGSATYQANGNITQLTDTTLTIRTKVQDVELTRDAKTQVTGKLSKGVSCSVTYDKVNGQPHATQITVKPGSHTVIN